MAITLVAGQIIAAQSGSTTATATLTNNPTLGNLVVVTVQGTNVGATISVQDGAGTPNVYTATTKTPFSSSTPPSSIGIFYFIATATANKAITVTFSASTVTDIYVAEFTGNVSSSVLENDATNNTTVAATTVNLPTITTTHNGCLLVSSVFTSATISTANSPWVGWAGGVPASGNYAAYTLQASSGAQALNYTQTSGTWSAIEASFIAVNDTLMSQILM